VPRVVGPIRRRHAVGVRDLEFLRRHTNRHVKATVPGPFTMAQQAQIDYYGGSRERAAMDYAAAVNAEIRDLFGAGADIVQIDEPYMQARPEEARAFGLAALNRSIETAQSSLDCAVLKALPGKKIILGVIDLASHEVESPELVASRIRRALPHVEAANLLVAPDCGMKYLPRAAAFGKLQAMVAGARLVRRELEGSGVAPHKV